MTLRGLSKAQSEAAFHAAHLLLSGNVHSARDCAEFREASLKLGSMIGDDREAGKLILEAVSWIGRDFLAATLCGLPVEVV